jgi:MazG family protein
MSTPAAQAFARLVEIIVELRAPGGCPWDREQTHQSLRRHLIEESYEVIEAIESSDDASLQEELGDLLMQPVMHAQIAAEAGRFDIAGVIDGITSKLVRRHPHVFGDVEVQNSGEVLRNWDAIKQAEKGEANSSTVGSVLGGVPKSLPALSSALEISKKAAGAGFEWPDADGVLAKLREETGELEAAIASSDQRRIEEELGDLLFTAVNIARWHGVDPELALRDMLHRFKSRFGHMESAACEKNVKLESLTPQQWDELWNAAKNLTTDEH